MEKLEIGRSEELVEQLAQKIDRWRMALPALVIFEAMRPFSFVASQGLLLCEPLLHFFSDDAQVGEYADLFADRSNLDRLIARLESRHQTPDRGARREKDE